MSILRTRGYWAADTKSGEWLCVDISDCRTEADVRAAVEAFGCVYREPPPRRSRRRWLLWALLAVLALVWGGAVTR